MHALMQLQTILLTLQHVIGKITSLGTVERPWKSTGICASRMPSYHQEVMGGQMGLGGS
jgi:hypothetical protein